MKNIWSEEFAGRERTKLGRWLDRNGITQGELTQWSGLGRNTISRVCSDTGYKATSLTKRTIVSSLQRKGYNVEEYDLW